METITFSRASNNKAEAEEDGEREREREEEKQTNKTINVQSFSGRNADVMNLRRRGWHFEALPERARRREKCIYCPEFLIKINNGHCTCNLIVVRHCVLIGRRPPRRRRRRRCQCRQSLRTFGTHGFDRADCFLLVEIEFGRLRQPPTLELSAGPRAQWHSAVALRADAID